jgi:HEPN domain-containing protein
MKKVTREWVRKAEVDYRAADGLRRKQTPVHEAVCFHCQQCAEKYLKALMEEVGLPIPKSHDLGLLLNSLVPHFRSLRPFRRGLNFLTGFAVDTRYPGKNASKRQAVAAFRWATRVRTTARAILRLRPPHPRRKRSP